MHEHNYKHSDTDSELGRKSEHDLTYNPDRLFPIARAAKRIEIGIQPDKPPFKGFDCWNHYEVSWLNAKGKPIVARAEIVYDCNSPFLIESKSLKLYFNSLNYTKFNTVADVERLVKQDLENRVQADVFIKLYKLDDDHVVALQKFSGERIDDLDVDCSVYLVEPNFLKTGDKLVEETLYSDLLKSNCLVTNQPDWGSVQIVYKGYEINREGLLKYLVSYRNHNEFHEQCIERIFIDIINYCTPQELTVYGRYTRRGGLDINPCRSTTVISATGKNVRLARQ